MKNLSVNIENTIYQISLQKDRTFLIRENGKAIGNIYPSQGHLKLIWKSGDQIEKQLIKELGECIESHQLSIQVL
ncbi:hypothetical protein QWY86_04895 [Pedobacter aquatilis]|uniref:hypothetical protein n=1 Tax=Pedobacter aquatilis TaxID=351343 RepID=UPI0025B5FC29|nr:hypothetical protein [Pedobacter aquatilis]MDN3585992.1 hypothetical protein [Pedobacter aquatilis]